MSVPGGGRLLYSWGGQFRFSRWDPASGTCEPVKDVDLTQLDGVRDLTGIAGIAARETSRAGLVFYGTRAAVAPELIDRTVLFQLQVTATTAPDGSITVSKVATKELASVVGALDDFDVGDIDGDGVPELVYLAKGTIHVASTADAVKALLVLPLPVAGLAPSAIHVRDFDHDGKAEIMGVLADGVAVWKLE